MEGRTAAMADVEADDRSRVTKASKPAKYNNAFEQGDDVWLENPQTRIYEWWMCVVAKRYNEYKQAWEYQVKDHDEGEGVLYNQGEWVLERKLRDG